MTAGRIADRIGRISVMKIAAVFFLISAIGTGLAPNVWLVVFFRIVGGIGVGIASVIAPAYIAETSPPRIRGRLGSLQQLAIVTGIFLSLAIDYVLAHIAGGANKELWLGLEAWRWMFLLMAIPAVVYGVLAFTIPESPRYLVATPQDSGSPQGVDHAAGREEPGDHHHPDPGDARARGQAVVARSAQARSGFFGLYGIVWVGLGLSVFQQFVGINVIFYYSNVLWEAVGFDESQSFLITVITSIVNIAHHADRHRSDRQDRPQAAAADRFDGYGGRPGHDGDHLRHGESGRRRQAVPRGRHRAHRADRRQPVRGRVRHVVGPGGVGAAR